MDHLPQRQLRLHRRPLSCERRAAATPAPGDDRIVTFVGALVDLTPDEAFVARGLGRDSPKLGWQFQVRDGRTNLSTTLLGMRKYLGSGLVKGVVAVNAGRIVGAFGEEAFTVVDMAPQRLQEVAGIALLRAQRITADSAEQRR